MKKQNRWMYAILGVIVLVFAGLIYAWSVLSSPMAAEFSNWSAGSLSLTFTLAMSFFCIGGFLAGLMAGKVKERYVLIISAVCFLLGLELVSVMQSLGGLYLGFGVLSGLGAGFSYNTIMGSITKWFPDKKGLISGILLMGFGIGAFLIGKVYAFLLASYDWRSEFRVLGILVAVIVLIASFLVRKPTEEEQREFAPAVTQQAEGKSVDVSTVEMMKCGSFWLYFVYAVLLSAAALALIAQASGIVTEGVPGLGAGSIATVVGLISIFNGVGRVIFGGLYDKLGQRKTMLLNCVIYLISVGITMVGLQSQSFVAIVLGFVCFGLSYGGVPPTNSAFIMDFFGVKHYPVNFSIINLNLLVASFGSTLAGMIYDQQGTYATIFMIMFVAVVISTICTLCIRRPKMG